MRASKEKNLIINTSTSNSNCFTSILKSFTCGGNLPSPTPSDHQFILPKFKSNGFIHPNPNELPKSEPISTNSHFLVHNESFEAGLVNDNNPRQPGLVARLMGLESMPSCPDFAFSKDSIMNLRSKSLNSLHLYILPDTFLDHVSPTPTFLQHQRRKPCHRRAQTSSPVLCFESSRLKEKLEPYACSVEEESVVSKPEKRRNGELSKRKKVDGENERNNTMSKKNDKKGLVVRRRKEIDECINGRKKALESKVDARKCSTRKRFSDPKDDPRKEIKYKDFGTKLGKEKGVCRIRNADESNPKDGLARPRRRTPRKSMMDLQHENTCEGLFQCQNEEQNSTGFQGKKLCSKTREFTKDRSELMAQVIRLTEEYVRDDEWINFDGNVKEVGVDFAGEMLEVLINQFLDELCLGKLTRRLEEYSELFMCQGSLSHPRR